MTGFFLPPSPGGDRDPELAYSELRARAEERTGSVPRDRRIAEIECRRSGQDCCLRVGDTDAANGMLVAAIIQTGRDTYTVHHVAATDELQAPAVLQRTDVYSVTDFG